MKTNVTYVISNIDKALAFEWIAANLDREKFNLSFVLLNPKDSALEKHLNSSHSSVKRITYKSKFDLPRAVFQLIFYFFKNQTHVVHCHLFDASLAGLFAAKIAGVKKRVYTRHHSNYHHKYFPRAVVYDNFINYLATDIVAISTVVHNVLVKLEKVKENKITLIPHGFDFNLFGSANPQDLKVKYNCVGNHPIVGVVARYTDWKGIQYIIPAFDELLKTYPQALLVLANANGDYSKEIKALLQKLPAKSYVEIEFEPQINLLFQMFDVYVHTPIDSEVEAFGQTYVEALASGIPSIFTLSGIANEFIVHEKNALVVDYKSSEAILEAFIRILSDDLLKQKLINNGKVAIEQFNLKNFIFKLEAAYLSK